MTTPIYGWTDNMKHGSPSQKSNEKWMEVDSIDTLKTNILLFLFPVDPRLLQIEEAGPSRAPLATDISLGNRTNSKSCTSVHTFLQQEFTNMPAMALVC